MRRLPVLFIVTAMTLTACSNGSPTKDSANRSPSAGSASPAASASPTDSASPAASLAPLANPGGFAPVPLADTDPAVHVAKIVFPAGGASCWKGDKSGTKAAVACPMTKALAAGLAKLGPGADPVCRCQDSPPPTLYTGVPGTDDNHVTVRVVLGTDPSFMSHFDLFVVRTTAGWYTSDIACTGKPNTGVLHGSFAQC